MRIGIIGGSVYSAVLKHLETHGLRDLVHGQCLYKKEHIQDIVSVSVFRLKLGSYILRAVC
jgi:hypothetical protein